MSLSASPKPSERTAASPIRQRHLDLIAEYVTRQGLEDASLRRLAAVAGVSHRMLIHYFGSRDGVLSAVLERLRSIESAQLMSSAPSRRAAMNRAWTYFTSPDRELEMRLFYFLCGQSLQAPSGSVDPLFDGGFIVAWTNHLTRLGIEEGCDVSSATVDARLMLGGARGLLLDRLMTADVAAIDLAFQRLLNSLLDSR